MKTEKSKILKLKKKFKRLTTLKEHQEFISMCLYFGGMAGVIISLMCPLPIWVYLIFGIPVFIGLATTLLEWKILNSIDNKRGELDDEIEKLIKEDELENQIFTEYQEIQRIQKEAKNQVEGKQNLINKLIEKKNKQASLLQKIIKDKMKGAKKAKREEIIKELENCTITESSTGAIFINENCKNINNTDTAGYTQEELGIQ